MGKKSREEREQKRENYADKITRQKIRFKIIAVGIVAALVILLVYVGIIFYQNTYQGGFTTPGTPPGAGKLGDEHEHAAMMVRIFGDTFDFSTPAYQVKNRYMIRTHVKDFFIMFSWNYKCMSSVYWIFI